MKQDISVLKITRADLATSGNYSLKVVMHYGSLVGFGGHLLFIFLFLWLGIQPMAVFNCFSCVIFLFAAWINYKGYTHLALLVGSGEIVAHASLAVAFLGWESSFQYYIIGLVPLIFYSRHWRNAFKISLAAILCLINIVLYLYSQQVPPIHSDLPQNIHLVSSINILTLFIVFAVLAHFYLSAATHAEEALKGANKNLEVLAHTDPLTKLLNRRNMLNQIAREIDRFTTTGSSFSLILCDIDNFKKYNDTYGHEAGDQILVNVSQVLSACTRENDCVARWGGEEFLILLPQTVQESARLIAERLREKIAFTPMMTGGVESKITMTFGVSTYSNFSEAAECIRRADEAMYQGKHMGRNCVVLYD